MQINLKCAPVESQVKGLASKWSGPVELQMLGHQDIFYLPSENRVNVIHPACGVDGLTIETFIENCNKEELNDIWTLCKRLKDTQGYAPTIILHNCNKVDAYEIVEMVMKMHDLNRGYDVRPKFAIENIMNIYLPHNICNTQLEDTIRAVKLCNNAMKGDYFSICLDIGHALANQRLWETFGIEHVTLEDYFKAYAPYCSTIHWNSCEGLGIKKEHRNTIVSPEDAELYASWIKKYDNQASMITIEVNDDSYISFDNSFVCYNNMVGLF